MFTQTELARGMRELDQWQKTAENLQKKLEAMTKHSADMSGFETQKAVCIYPILSKYKMYSKFKDIHVINKQVVKLSHIRFLRYIKPITSSN